LSFLNTISLEKSLLLDRFVNQGRRSLLLDHWKTSSLTEERIEHDLILVDELLAYKGPNSKEMMVGTRILTETKAEGSCTLQAGSYTDLTPSK
jgi:hypothetical protein